MAYLTREELYTHLYKGIIKEINREDNLVEYAAVENFPLEGEPDITYVALDTMSYYQWATNAYAPFDYIDNALEAIAAAIDEVKGYLTAYDLTAIFGATGNNRNKIILLYTKDVTVWHYIQLANPAVDMDLRLKRYEQAIEFLKGVQSGKINPSLPYPTEPPAAEANNYIKHGGIDKRNNNF